jgi:copper oxidase (laccase) domain-containing protein
VEINAVGGKDIKVFDNTEEIKNLGDLEFDGAITSHKDFVFALNAADCIPLVITAPNRPLLALIHVGFSGADLGIHLKVIDIISDKFKIQPSNLKVYFGPHIKKESYLLKDLKNKKIKGKWSRYAIENGGIYSIDLTGFVLNGLIKAGIKKNNIEISKINTGSNKNYFSHRRSAITGEVEGRNGFICVLD